MSQADNAADETEVKERGKKSKDKRTRELDDVFFILGSPQGRRFFWRYLGRCGIFRTSMTGNNTTFFNEGERMIGLNLLADLNEANPEAYAVMQKEAALEALAQLNSKPKKEESQDA